MASTLVVYSVPNYPGRPAKSKMAANKVRGNVTSSLTSEGAPDDVMVVQETLWGGPVLVRSDGVSRGDSSAACR